MYTSDQQLAALGLRPMSEIPTRPGFACIGRLRNGEEVSLRVYRNAATGEYKIVGAPSVDDLVGWKHNCPAFNR